MFARYAVLALIASFALAAVISPGCDPCPKCTAKKLTPTVTLTPFSPTPIRFTPTPTASGKATPTATATVVATPTGTATVVATPTATATVAPGPVGGAPLGSLTVLITGSYVPSSAVARRSQLIGSVTSGGASGVTAYIPDGDYTNGMANVEVVPVTGTTPTRATVTTTNPVNSCSANQNTGTVVCTDNLNGIYLINGNTLSSTLTSGGVNQESFSGGSCTTCGVVVDSARNQAIISIASNVSPTPASTPIPAGPGAYQIINLANNTLSAPISGVGTNQIAESFGLNTGANMILSADEEGFFDLIDITNPASPIAYAFVNAPLEAELDTAAIDSTGITIAGGEGTGELFLADLSQVTFSPGANPPTWNAPNQLQDLPEFDPSFGYFSAGLTGIAIASGTNEAFLEDEFGFAGFGAGIGAIKLPATGGGGMPAAADWVVAHMPTTPDNNSWDMSLDPHGLTAANANLTIASNGVGLGTTSKGIGFVINDERTYLGVVDLDALLAAPRAAADAHQLDPNYQPLQQNVITYIPVNSTSTVNQIQNGDFNDGFGFYTTGIVAGGSSSGFPTFNVSTDAGSCLTSQFGNPFASLNVPNGADGFFQQQVAVPDAEGQVVSFTSWGNVSPVTVTVSVISSGGPVVLGSFTAPQILTNDTTCSSISPATESFSLNQFEGQMVTIRFEATSTGSDQAIANFDNMFVGTGDF